jgi:hypothetical protein
MGNMLLRNEPEVHGHSLANVPGSLSLILADELN